MDMYQKYYSVQGVENSRFKILRLLGSIQIDFAQKMDPVQLFEDTNCNK